MDMFDTLNKGLVKNAVYDIKEGGMFTDIAITTNYDTKAMSDAFLKRYKSNSLTDEDKEWEKDFFAFRYIDEVKIDGKPVYTREQIERKGEKETAAELLGAVLSGKKVSYKDYEYGSEYIVEYDNNNYDKFEKSIWDKIVDFVRQALGLDKNYNFIKSIQSDNENLREKLSFEELSGIKNIKNVKSPSADKKDPIIERNEPTR